MPPVPDEIIVLAVATVTAPIYEVAVVVLFVIAPIAPFPVPFIVSGSVSDDVYEKPLRSSVPPDETMIPPPVVPVGPFAAEEEDTPSFNVPNVTFVAPV
jgi:hypothetical protein